MKQVSLSRSREEIFLPKVTSLPEDNLCTTEESVGLLDEDLCLDFVSHEDVSISLMAKTEKVSKYRSYVASVASLAN